MRTRTPALAQPQDPTLRSRSRRSDRSPTLGPTLLQDRRPLAHSLRILFVEDDPDLRVVTHRVLQSFGHDVLSCGFPEQALMLFDEAEPAIDLLVTDVEMPCFSGIVLAEELTRRRPGLPVLIVSGAHLSLSDQECIGEHQWMFLSKPVRLPDLEAAVRSLGRSAAAPISHDLAAAVPACT